MNEKTAELMKAFETDEFEREFWNGYSVYFPRGSILQSGTHVMILENGDSARLSSIRESQEYGEYVQRKSRTTNSFSDPDA